MDDAGVRAVQSEVTAMEASVRRLDKQKERFSFELDNALRHYKQLQKQDGQLDKARIQTRIQPNPHSRTESAR